MSQKKKKIKVLFFHAYYMTKGGECHVFENESQLMRKFEELNVEIIFFNNKEMNNPIIGLYKYFIFSLTLLKRFLINRPNIIHYHNIFPLFIFVPFIAKIFAIKNIITAHNYRHSCLNGLFFNSEGACEKCLKKTVPIDGIKENCFSQNSFKNIFVAIYTIIYGQLVKSFIIDRIVCLSNFSKEKLLDKGVPHSKLLTKENSISNNKTQEEKGLPNESYVFIGRLSREKGILELLNFWSLHMGHRQINVYGAGPLEAEVQIVSNQSKNIHYKGILESSLVISTLKSSQGLIFPSFFYEAQPLILIEAMHAGTKIFASDVGAIPELINDYSNSYLYKPGNFSQLHEKLIVSEKELSGAIWSGSRKFTSEYTSEVLLGLYLKLVES